MNAEPLREKLAIVGHLMPPEVVDKLVGIQEEIEGALLDGDSARVDWLHRRYTRILDGCSGGA